MTSEHDTNSLTNESRIPALKPGERVLWKRNSPVSEVCTVEIGVGLRWLIDHLGWVIGVMAATFAILFGVGKVSLEMTALLVSSATLALAPLWIALVSIFDYIEAGDETYVLTNRRIIRVGKKDAVEMWLSSDSMEVRIKRTFGDAGTVTFSDPTQERPCIVVCCKDKVAECRTYLPNHLALKVKGIRTDA